MTIEAAIGPGFFIFFQETIQGAAPGPQIPAPSNTVSLSSGVSASYFREEDENETNNHLAIAIALLMLNR